jgi:hypothetical protein
VPKRSKMRALIVGTGRAVLPTRGPPAPGGRRRCLFDASLIAG